MDASSERTGAARRLPTARTRAGRVYSPRPASSRARIDWGPAPDPGGKAPMTAPAPSESALPSDPVATMLAHNAWANRHLIEACAALTDEQLDREFPMGLGTLRRTVTHIIGAMRGWTDLLAKRPARDRLENHAPVGPAEWQTLHDEAAADMAEHALAGPIDEVLTAERAGKSYSFVRSHVLVHVTTHGVHHRAQCLNMLRQLGVTDLPPNSGMTWAMTDGA